MSATRRMSQPGGVGSHYRANASTSSGFTPAQATALGRAMGNVTTDPDEHKKGQDGRPDPGIPHTSERRKDTPAPPLSRPQISKAAKRKQMQMAAGVPAAILDFVKFAVVQTSPSDSGESSSDNDSAESSLSKDPRFSDGSFDHSARDEDAALLKAVRLFKTEKSGGLVNKLEKPEGLAHNLAMINKMIQRIFVDEAAETTQGLLDACKHIYDPTYNSKLDPKAKIFGEAELKLSFFLTVASRTLSILAKQVSPDRAREYQRSMLAKLGRYVSNIADRQQRANMKEILAVKMSNMFPTYMTKHLGHSREAFKERVIEKNTFLLTWEKFCDPDFPANNLHEVAADSSKKAAADDIKRRTVKSALRGFLGVTDEQVASVISRLRPGQDDEVYAAAHSEENTDIGRSTELDDVREELRRIYEETTDYHNCDFRVLFPEADIEGLSSKEVIAFLKSHHADPVDGVESSRAASDDSGVGKLLDAIEAADPSLDVVNSDEPTLILGDLGEIPVNFKDQELADIVGGLKSAVIKNALGDDAALTELEDKTIQSALAGKIENTVNRGRFLSDLRDCPATVTGFQKAETADNRAREVKLTGAPVSVQKTQVGDSEELLPVKQDLAQTFNNADLDRSPAEWCTAIRDSFLDAALADELSSNYLGVTDANKETFKADVTTVLVQGSTGAAIRTEKALMEVQTIQPSGIDLEENTLSFQIPIQSDDAAGEVLLNLRINFDNEPEVMLSQLADAIRRSDHFKPQLATVDNTTIINRLPDAILPIIEKASTLNRVEKQFVGDIKRPSSVTLSASDADNAENVSWGYKVPAELAELDEDAEVEKALAKIAEIAKNPSNGADLKIDNLDPTEVADQLRKNNSVMTAVRNVVRDGISAEVKRRDDAKRLEEEKRSAAEADKARKAAEAAALKQRHDNQLEAIKGFDFSNSADFENISMTNNGKSQDNLPYNITPERVATEILSAASDWGVPDLDDADSVAVADAITQNPSFKRAYALGVYVAHDAVPDTFEAVFTAPDKLTKFYERRTQQYIDEPSQPLEEKDRADILKALKANRAIHDCLRNIELEAIKAMDFSNTDTGFDFSGAHGKGDTALSVSIANPDGSLKDLDTILDEVAESLLQELPKDSTFEEKTTADKAAIKAALAIRPEFQQRLDAEHERLRAEAEAKLAAEKVVAAEKAKQVANLQKKNELAKLSAYAVAHNQGDIDFTIPFGEGDSTISTCPLDPNSDVPYLAQLAHAIHRNKIDFGLDERVEISIPDVEDALQANPNIKPAIKQATQYHQLAALRTKEASWNPTDGLVLDGQSIALDTPADVQASLGNVTERVVANHGGFGIDDKPTDEQVSSLLPYNPQLMAALNAAADHAKKQAQLAQLSDATFVLDNPKDGEYLIPEHLKRRLADMDALAGHVNANRAAYGLDLIPSITVEDIKEALKVNDSIQALRVSDYAKKEAVRILNTPSRQALSLAALTIAPREEFFPTLEEVEGGIKLCFTDGTEYTVPLNGDITGFDSVDSVQKAAVETVAEVCRDRDTAITSLNDGLADAFQALLKGPIQARNSDDVMYNFKKLVPSARVELREVKLDPRLHAAREMNPDGQSQAEVIAKTRAAWADQPVNAAVGDSPERWELVVSVKTDQNTYTPALRINRESLIIDEEKAVRELAPLKVQLQSIIGAENGLRDLGNRIKGLSKLPATYTDANFKAGWSPESEEAGLCADLYRDIDALDDVEAKDKLMQELQARLKYIKVAGYELDVFGRLKVGDADNGGPIYADPNDSVQEALRKQYELGDDDTSLGSYKEAQVLDGLRAVLGDYFKMPTAEALAGLGQHKKGLEDLQENDPVAQRAIDGYVQTEENALAFLQAIQDMSDSIQGLSTDPEAALRLVDCSDDQLEPFFRDAILSPYASGENREATTASIEAQLNGEPGTADDGPNSTNELLRQLKDLRDYLRAKEEQRALALIKASYETEGQWVTAGDGDYINTVKIPANLHQFTGNNHDDIRDILLSAIPGLSKHALSESPRVRRQIVDNLSELRRREMILRWLDTVDPETIPLVERATVSIGDGVTATTAEIKDCIDPQKAKHKAVDNALDNLVAGFDCQVDPAMTSLFDPYRQGHGQVNQKRAEGEAARKELEAVEAKIATEGNTDALKIEKRKKQIIRDASQAELDYFKAERNENLEKLIAELNSAEPDWTQVQAIISEIADTTPNEQERNYWRGLGYSLRFDQTPLDYLDKSRVTKKDLLLERLQDAYLDGLSQSDLRDLYKLKAEADKVDRMGMKDRLQKRVDKLFGPRAKAAFTCVNGYRALKDFTLPYTKNTVSVDTPDGEQLRYNPKGPKWRKSAAPISGNSTIFKIRGVGKSKHIERISKPEVGVILGKVNPTGKGKAKNADKVRFERLPKGMQAIIRRYLLKNAWGEGITMDQEFDVFLETFGYSLDALEKVAGTMEAMSQAYEKKGIKRVGEYFKAAFLDQVEAFACVLGTIHNIDGEPPRNTASVVKMQGDESRIYRGKLNPSAMGGLKYELYKWFLGPVDSLLDILAYCDFCADNEETEARIKTLLFPIATYCGYESPEGETSVDTIFKMKEKVQAALEAEIPHVGNVVAAKQVAKRLAKKVPGHASLKRRVSSRTRR